MRRAWAAALFCGGCEEMQLDVPSTAPLDATSAPTATSCSADCSPTDSAATLVLSFQLDMQLANGMREPPVGTLRGAAWAAADVGPDGVGDAVPLAEFTSDVVELDLQGGVLGAAATIEEVPIVPVRVLACLDLAGDGCGCGDPQTDPEDAEVIDLLPGVSSYICSLTVLAPC